MTPKGKAKELCDKYELIVHNVYDDTEDNIRHVKECALIVVDEIIAQIEPSVSMDVISARITYWQRVKQEIENIKGGEQ